MSVAALPCHRYPWIVRNALIGYKIKLSSSVEVIYGKVI